MKQELKTIGIEQILKLSDTVDAYALGNDFILGEASGGNVLVNTRLLPDNTTAQEMAGQVGAMLREYIPRAQAVSDSVTEYLKEPSHKKSS